MRNMTPQMQAAISARMVQPAILASLTFNQGTMNVWTGIGDIVANGVTYSGIGSLGSIGTISEMTTVEAAGTSVTLNGCDPTIYADAISDIKTGQPASIWLACLNGTTVLGTILIFKGLIDIPTVSEGADDISISLALESKLTNLQRANRRLWTDTEQRRKYPTDSGFQYVNALVDCVNNWGG
jgi:hypothetical protein